MYKLDIPLDRKEAAAIKRRRHLEDLRKCRIFNARERLIGVDHNVLDWQVRERKARDDLEKQREQAIDADMVRNSKLAFLLHQRQERDLRELNKQLNEYRHFHQQPQNQREWDLNDPDRLKKDLPARICDDDPRLGLASMQKFEGEDVNHPARVKHQQEQYRNWLLLQKQEKEDAKKLKEEAQRLYDLKTIELTQRTLDLQLAQQDCRKAIAVANENFNKALAEEARDRRRVRDLQETNDKISDIVHNITGDFLNENASSVGSAFGPDKIVVDRYRGMTQEQKNEILGIQKQQLEAKKLIERQKKLEEDEWQQYQNSLYKELTLRERQQVREQKEMEKILMKENLKLAKIQKKFNEHLNKEVYTNSPTAAYFLQFNTTTR